VDLKNLWTKLFIRKNQDEEIGLHSAGAIVRHHNPFESLEVPRNEKELSKEFIDTWVVPFYMSNLQPDDDNTIKAFAVASNKIDIEIVSQLLGDFNWRTRIVGAYFATVKNYKELDNIIGRHLVKSEVCYAGVGYCLALTTFATQKAKDYLISYLEYYLQREDLWFEQAEAFCALEQLDPVAAGRYKNQWKDFITNKPNWDLTKSRINFLEQLEFFAKVSEAARKN
jgi:hypothetical protein